MSVYYLAIIPFLLWVVSIFLQNDRLCSRTIANIFLLVAALCFVGGVVLHHYEVFPQKSGFFVVAFGTPLLLGVIWEICRLIYVAIRHENPCFNYRSGRWLGDPPRNGFYTTYPPEKVISWADVLFGLSVTVISYAAVMVLFIWSLAANW